MQARAEAAERFRSVRDESLHTESIIKLFRTFISENPLLYIERWLPGKAAGVLGSELLRVLLRLDPAPCLVPLDSMESLRMSHSLEAKL